MPNKKCIKNLVLLFWFNYYSNLNLEFYLGDHLRPNLTGKKTIKPPVLRCTERDGLCLVTGLLLLNVTPLVSQICQMWNYSWDLFTNLPFTIIHVFTFLSTFAACCMYCLCYRCMCSDFLFCVTLHRLPPKLEEKVSANKRIMTEISDFYTKCRELYIWIFKICNLIIRKKRQSIGGANSMLQLETRINVPLTSRKDMTLSK